MKCTLLLILKIFYLICIAILFSTAWESSYGGCTLTLIGYDDLNNLSSINMIDIQTEPKTCYNMADIGFTVRSVDFSECIFNSLMCLSWYADSNCSSYREQTDCRVFDDKLISIYRGENEELNAIKLWNWKNEKRCNKSFQLERLRCILVNVFDHPSLASPHLDMFRIILEKKQILNSRFVINIVIHDITHSH